MSDSDKVAATNHRPMKILFVLTNDGFGGGEFYVRDFARALVEAGHDVRVFIAGERRDLAQELASVGVSTLLSGHEFRLSRPGLVTRNGLKLRRSVRGWHPNLVIGNLPRSIILSAVFLPLTRRVSLLHGPLRDDPISRMAGPLTRRLLANTPVTASSVQAKLGRQLPYAVVLPTAIVGPLDVSQPRETMTMIGRWQPYKGHEDFVRVAVKVRAAKPEAKFCIIGSVANPEQQQHHERVMHLIRSSGLDSCTTVLVDATAGEVAETLRRTRIYAHLAKSEDFGISVVESLLAGCGNVAYAAVGPSMILEGHDCARIVPIGNVDAFAEQVIDLWDNTQPDELIKSARALGLEFGYGRHYVEACDSAIRALA